MTRTCLPYLSTGGASWKTGSLRASVWNRLRNGDDEDVRTSETFVIGYAFRFAFGNRSETRIGFSLTKSRIDFHFSKVDSEMTN